MRIGLGHGLFALAAAGLAISSLTFRGFAPIWQPFLASIPSREIWVYGSALLVLAASAGLCFSRTALASALAIGAYQAAWAASRATTIAFKPLSVGSWYGFCEALTPMLGAWILYWMLRSHARFPQTPSTASARAVRAAQILFGLNCCVYGLAHFAYADFTASMVPSWLPSPLAFAYLTGLAHLIAGIAISTGILPRLAATLEAVMMSLFGLLVWAPTLFEQSRPDWVGTPQNQWSEIVVTLLLAASAWIVATS